MLISVYSLLPPLSWLAISIRWSGFVIPWAAETEKAMAPHSSTLTWKNPMDGVAWWATVHGVAKSWTRLSD